MNERRQNVYMLSTSLVAAVFVWTCCLLGRAGGGSPWGWGFNGLMAVAWTIRVLYYYIKILRQLMRKP